MSRAGNGRAVVSDPKARDLMKRYADGGETMTALAAEVGVTTSALSQRFKRIQTKDKAAAIPPAVRDELEELRNRVAHLETQLKLFVKNNELRWK